MYVHMHDTIVVLTYENEFLGHNSYLLLAKFQIRHCLHVFTDHKSGQESYHDTGFDSEVLWTDHTCIFIWNFHLNINILCKESIDWVEWVRIFLFNSFLDNILFCRKSETAFELQQKYSSLCM